MPTVGEFIDEYKKTGREAPYLAEVQVAKEILAKAPSKTTPFEVANFFFEVGQGRYGDNWVNYVKEWPVRANPVIVSFFDATTTRKPAGDTTAWCAAFVNWCIQQGAKGRDTTGFAGPTKSAASSSFRSNWGRKLGEDEKPSVGDLVVFKLKSDASHGHVAFFVSDAGKGRIYILGGNQGALAHDNNGEVNIKSVETDSSYWQVVGYFTALELRG
ncbi:CHAP domain-containing protein [Mesorhizobium sp. WSM4904]|uniref:CHAP domain-containing protein n=1 Tax=Mesorhizobium sp. WSM4904 TaxID=3038545 RepID=UPI0024184F51|nr:CHAP domain-containing protein [Mesorhizobium sp. WSM4904]WFP61581.1 CHAP domain-containing protein [Mesorhizobium sp. WSM4904]